MFRKLIAYADKKVDLRKFIRFGLVGVMNTAVDWLAFALMIELLSVEARIAQVIAQSLAIANSYIINKRWTFRDKRAHSKSALKFLAVQGTGLLLGYLSMRLFHDRLGVNPYLSRLVITGATIVLNYFGNKLFVFKGGGP